MTTGFQLAEKITKVEEGDTLWSISIEGGGFGLLKSYGVEPKVGDRVAVRLQGGSLVVGVKLNDVVVFDKDDYEIHLDSVKLKASSTLEKVAQFEKDREKLDADFKELPQLFQERIEKFRSNNPDFRWDFESYELFCCKQALLIANALKTPEAIKAFSEKPFHEQEKEVLFLSDEHSGNSFAVAVKLAFFYVTNPANVVKMHGALAQLVGSRAYGDVPSGEAHA